MAETAEALAQDRLADAGLALLVARIREELHPEQIWLFGSRARGDARPDSDYDLFVIVPDDTPGERISPVSTLGLAREAPISTDLLAYRSHVFAAERDLIGTLCYTVAREGALIYEDHGSRPQREAPPMTAGGRKPTANDVIGRWLKRAEMDLQIVRNCLHGPVPSPEGAAYHCQQAAEKIMKAGLIAAGVHPPKEHDIGKLNALFPTGHPLLPVFRPLEALSAYITAFRYPGEPDVPVPSLAEIEAWLPRLLRAKQAVIAAMRPGG